jgi:hypothetical protein
MYDIDIHCTFDEIGIVKGGDADGERMMYGWASTPSIDADGEKLIQDGLNFSPFINKGWVNWDHQRHNILGTPKVCEIRTRPDGTKGTYTEFALLKGVPMADHVWSLSQALEKNNSDRKLGLSLEGRTISKSKTGVIERADIMGLAVTPYPKNGDTSVSAFMKSMTSGEPATPFLVDPYTQNELMAVAAPLADAIRKALDSGYDTGGTTQTGGAAVRKESMGSGKPSFNPDQYAPLYEHLDPATKEACEAISKVATERGNLTKSEAALFIHLTKGFPVLACMAAVGMTEE